MPIFVSWRPGVAAFSLAVLVLGVFACGAEVGRVDRAGDDTADGSPVLVGVLNDEAGLPLAGVQVMACMATTCLYDQSEADGGFRFSLEAPAQLVIKTAVDVSATPRRAAAMVPVELTDESLTDVGPVHIPSLPEGAPIAALAADPQTMTVGDGLELSLRRADLTPALGDVLVDVAARRLPPDLIPPSLVPPGEELIAVYALHPFAARSESPIAVRAPSTLPPGTAVRWRTISEIDGRFSDAVPGRASGTYIATDPSEGITELTYVVISR